MGDMEGQANALMEKANKKLNSWGLFGNKYEDAAELLSQAANKYKIAKSCACSMSWMCP